MKLRTNKADFDRLPVTSRYFLARWKQLKGRPVIKEWEFLELIELTAALGNDLRFETSVRKNDEASAMFNNVLDLDEILLAWDGSQPIMIAFYKMSEKVKRRIIQHLTVNQNR